jgi:hypothetical protein
MSCFNVVEYNMQMRQAMAANLLLQNESLLSISFPALGTIDFTSPQSEPKPNDPSGAGCSVFFPDAAIYGGHPRHKNIFN